MISIPRLFARHAVDEEFRRLLGLVVADALESGERDRLPREVNELCEAHAQASRAIDTCIPE